jgi:hypothetical protein
MLSDLVRLLLITEGSLAQARSALGSRDAQTQTDAAGHVGRIEKRRRSRSLHLGHRSGALQKVLSYNIENLGVPSAGTLCRLDHWLLMFVLILFIIFSLHRLSLLSL